MDANRAPPFVECVEHIGFAEIDADGPPAGTFSVVALEIAIDAMPHDLGRNASRGPSRHQLEGRSDNTYQVAVILPAEVCFDVAAVLIGIVFWSHRAFCGLASSPSLDSYLRKVV